MRKIRIKVKASSANLGVGFDFLGLGLNIYNIYEFCESKQVEFINFSLNEGENLVFLAYKKIFELMNRPIVPITITEKKRNIPIARGLGSSASLIIAGVLAANYFGKFELREMELLDIMSKMEGHPDNVVASYYGGLVSTISENGYIRLIENNKISPNLNFYVYIPDYEVKTIDARKVLPSSLPYKDVVFNISRAFIAKDAFLTGDFYSLRIALEDAIHEKYRAKLIKEYDEIKKEFEKEGRAIVKISGSGSTLLIISNLILNDDRLKEVEVDYHKTKIEEIKE